MKLLNDEQIVHQVAGIAVTNRRVVQEIRRALVLTDTRQLLIERIDSADVTTRRQRLFLWLAGIGAISTLVGLGTELGVAVAGVLLMVVGVALFAFWSGRVVVIRSGASAISTRRPLGGGAAQQLVAAVYQAKDQHRRS